MNSKSALLVLPAALAVTTFVTASACQNNDNEPEYCADIEEMSKCNEAEGCGWDADSDDCKNTCNEIEDEQVCMEFARCEWYPDGAPEGTGGGEGGCGQTFT